MFIYLLLYEFLKFLPSKNNAVYLLCPKAITKKYETNKIKQNVTMQPGVVWNKKDLTTSGKNCNTSIRRICMAYIPSVAFPSVSNLMSFNCFSNFLAMMNSDSVAESVIKYFLNGIA